MFTIVLFIIVIILDEGSSIGDITRDVVEVSVVARVSKDDIVGYTLNSLLGRASGIKDLRNFITDNCETVGFLQVLIFFNQPVSISESDGSEEER